MSLPKKQLLSCPQCRESYEFTSYDSINTERDSAVSDVVSGRLFEAVCPHCSHKILVDYPLLFNDLKHNVIVSYVRPGELDEMVKASSAISGLGCRLRIVTSRRALQEKVAVFDADLDDRVTELLKVIVINQLQDQLRGREVTGAFFHPDRESPAIEFLMDDGSAYIGVDMTGYAEIRKTFAAELADREKDLLVDERWAVDFLSEYMRSE